MDERAQQLLLDGLLARCSTRQRLSVSEALRQVQHVDVVGTLPPELALRVLLHLDALSLCRASQVRSLCSVRLLRRSHAHPHALGVAHVAGAGGRQQSVAAHVPAAYWPSVQKLWMGSAQPARAGTRASLVLVCMCVCVCPVLVCVCVYVSLIWL
jgi:hypothetical protein